jgi:GNAT superfamily N-acetyltransferase
VTPYHLTKAKSARKERIKDLIRELIEKDAQHIFEIINMAAKAYEGKIPTDCYHQPYMSMLELLREMKMMTFYGCEEKGKLAAVMAIQAVGEVTLIRHAYVLPEYQKIGVGTKLLDFLRHLTGTKDLMVGTWVDAKWAIAFYEKHGFRILPDKDALLKKYWNIPQRQIDTSLVMGVELSHFID